MPTLPEIANLAFAAAMIWIGGAVVISAVDRVRAYLRHHRPAVRRQEPSNWNPGPAQDL